MDLSQFDAAPLIAFTATKETTGIVNLSDLGEKEPHTLRHAAFNSLVISSQML